MSAESARSVTRSATRRLMFDCISGVTTPEGRCVASTRLHAERAADARDAHEAVDELGQLGLELGELVDDDHQPRRARGGRRSRRPSPRRPSTSFAFMSREHPLAALQLGVERGERALGLAGVEVR